MPVGNSLGIKSKIEPDLDESSARRMVDDLEEQIAQVEQLQFEGDFQGRTMPGADGGGLGGPDGGMGMGPGAAGAAGGLVSKLGGGAMAGAAILGTVALGGTLATSMYQAMSQSSGRLQATNSMLGTALDLALKPLGDLIGSALMPYAKGALEAMASLNQHIASDGLIVGGLDWLQDTITSLPRGIASAVANSFRGQFEILTGDKFKPENLFEGGKIGVAEFLAFVEFPGITALEFLDQFGWPGIGVGQFLGMASWPAITTAAFLNPVSWPAIGAAAIISQIDWPTIGQGDLIDEITGGGGDGGDTGERDGGGGGGGDGGLIPPGYPDPFDLGDQGGDTNQPQYLGGENTVRRNIPGEDEVNVTMEMDGRRLSEGVRERTNQFYNMTGY